MNQAVKRVIAVLFFMLMLCVLPTQYVLADVPEEMTQQTEQMTEEQESIEDEEIPLAASGVENYEVFLWGGMVMVILLAAITGYSSFETVNMKKTK